MSGFKAFLLRGNVIELAVAVVIGGAFTAIVNAFVTAVIDPIIALATPDNDIDELTLGPILIGVIISAVINFILIAAVVYFVIVLPFQKLKEASDRRKGIVAAEEPETEADILKDIRELLQSQKA